MSHNSVSRHHSASAVQSDATPNTDLVSAFCQMTSGIKKPKRIAWKMYDAARGRPINPLGTFPEVAEECIEAGASFYNVSRPLEVMMAHLKRRFRNTLGCISLKDAIRNAAQEGSEAEVSVLSLALSANCPDTSSLASADKELREAIQAEEALAECIEAKLYAEKK